MTIKIDAKVLHHALKQLSPVAGTNSSLPILSYVLLTVKDGTLFSRATNLTTTITTESECDTKEDVSMVVPYRELTNICAEAKGTLVIENKGVISILTSTDTYKLGEAHDVKNYPTPHQFDTISEFDADKDFIKALATSKQTVTKDLLNERFRNISLIGSGGKVSITSSDMNNLYNYCDDLKCTKDFKCLVDPILATSASSMLEAHVKIGQKFISVKSLNTEILTTLSEQVFPDVSKLIECEFFNVEVKKSDFISAISKAMVFDSKYYTFELSFKKGKILLRYDDTYGNNSFDTTIKAKHSVDFDDAVAVNGSMLKQLINMVDGDDVSMSFKSQRDNVHISGGDSREIILIRPLVINALPSKEEKEK